MESVNALRKLHRPNRNCECNGNVMKRLRWQHVTKNFVQKLKQFSISHCVKGDQLLNTTVSLIVSFTRCVLQQTKEKRNSFSFSHSHYEMGQLFQPMRKQETLKVSVHVIKAQYEKPQSKESSA